MAGWQALSSSNVLAMDYDSGSQELHVQFIRGRTGTYHGVPQDVADGLRSAASPGTYVNSVLKPGYRYTPG